MGEISLQGSKNLSKHLSERQISAINRVGDVMIPGDGEFPSFSGSGCVRHVDRVLNFMPAQDLGDLKILLLLLSLFPPFLIAWFLGFLERTANWGSWLDFMGGILRLIRLGLRGLIVTLYYSNRPVLDQIPYQVGVYTADIR